MTTARAAATIGLLMLVGCGPAEEAAEEPASLLLEISSTFDIPVEVNELRAQIESDGAIIGQQTYALDEPPRDSWPQTLPIHGGDQHASAVDVALELRLRLTEDEPPVLRGQVTERFAFPAEGTRSLQIEIARDCVDGDGDRYGEGMGCRGADCDDTDAELTASCPEPEVGCTLGGGQCDAESELCHEQVCHLTCDMLSWWFDCGRKQHLTCLEDPGVCVCRTPCSDDAGCEVCSPLDPYCAVSETWTCVEGCCAP